MQINFELEPGAHAPTRAHASDAGWDLYARSFSASTLLIDTGVHVLIPTGYVGLVLPRSSINAQGLHSPVGVIDAGYTGTVKVALWGTGLSLDRGYLHFSLFDGITEQACNSQVLTDGDVLSMGAFNYGIREGDRIAQLVIMPLPAVELVEGPVTSVQTDRGANGFGSTGK